MKTIPVLFAAAAGAALLISCSKSQAKVAPAQPPIVIVFADVTDSLQKGGAEAVDAAILDIFDRAPEEATIRVFPIVAGTDVVRGVETTLPFRTNTGVVELQKAYGKRVDAARQVTSMLAAVRRKLHPRTQSSCISGAIRRAASEMTLSDGRPVDVVIISDMVEDCGRSINDGTIALTRPGIAREISLARALTPAFADLRRADVYFIHPGNIDAAVSPNSRSATYSELRTFWSTVATRCNARIVHFLGGSEGYRNTQWPSARKELESLRGDRGVASATAVRP